MADIELVVKIPEEIINEINDENYQRIIWWYDTTLYRAIKDGTPLPKGHGRKFEEIVVNYPPAELCTYPEYRGKPYFSIKYEENGEHFIGFGTYNPKVLSEFLREYFITPTIEADKESE